LDVSREIQTTTNNAPCPWKIGFWRLNKATGDLSVCFDLAARIWCAKVTIP
jgi:hypothetical protein